ncbi:MAG: alpha-2-macroglobulin family protein [Ferruginibacter sp.]
MKLRISLLATAILLTFCNLMAQTNDYKTDWKKLEDFEKKGLTKSALEQAVKIFNLALAAGNEPQQIKAAMYQMKYRNMVQEDNRENNIFYLDTLIAKTKAPSKNILQSMQAELFWSYKQNNRYKFYDRTKLTEEKSKDISTWSLDKLNKTSTSLYKASLKNEELLKATKLEGLEAVLEKGKNTRQLRPTLYDLLVHRSLGYFMDGENDVTNPAYKFIINDEIAFAPVKEFTQAKFSSKDTASLYLHALKIFQDILKFHAGDAKPDALLDADLKRLAFVNEHGVFTNKEKLYEAALKEMETRYAGNALVAQAMYLRAVNWRARGTQYNPFTGKENQFYIKKAKEICDEAIAKYPGSEGAINCHNLLAEINNPFLNLETEKVNVPGMPFRTLVKYKNVSSLYLRVIKTTRTELKKLERNDDYNRQWALMADMTPVKAWTVSLPNQQDYQQHSAEIKIDELPTGTYIILASVNANFKPVKNYLARQITYISNIAYITNNKNELYVLDRSLGLPLANADVQLWQQNYDYNSRNYDDIKKEKYKSDKNGYVKMTRMKDSYYNQFVQVSYGKDELFTDDSYYSYYYNGIQPEKTNLRTFFFTDRSIYRPGQTVFFKGIVVSTNSQSRKSVIVPGHTATVMLMDANHQKVEELSLKTNEYGSFSGKFVLPEGRLNGNFFIQEAATSSQQYFSVEEYKRPKFSVEIKKPEGSYRVNDSITVTGFAKAYAGNNIDGAAVSYRVVRRVQYPIWWGWGYRGRIWPPYGRSEEMEIANGIAKTDEKGEFKIIFKAIPDESVDKKDQPTFYYDISADVTDINGETRSSETSVAVSYQALQLAITAPEKMPADSLKNILVSSRNSNGLFEKATVTVQIFKLQEPGRMFRQRYWEAPDQFVMTKEEYYKHFPYDVYADEDQVGKFSQGQKVSDKTDTTSANSTFKIQHSALQAGWYKIIATGKDKYGEDVKAEKYIYLTDKTKRSNEPITLDANKKTAEPGEKIDYNLQTGFDKVWLIHSLSKTDNSTIVTYPSLSTNQPVNFSLNPTEADRGGIRISYAFVKNNRVYSGGDMFSIPWTNKELNISYETFRDKLLPGANEKWKIKISGSKGEKIASEALISMYDASLDQFKPHYWTALSSLWPTLNDFITWSGLTFTGVQSTEHNNMERPYKDLPEKRYDELVSNGWNEGGYMYYNGLTKRSMLTYANAEVSASVAAPAPQMADGKPEEADSMSPKHMKLPKPVFDDSDGDGIVDQLDKDPSGPPSGKGNGGNTQIRKNFNETAFFFPELKTDANGNVEFSFTIPEALTSWNMMTLAHDKNLASGMGTKSVITQKPLMVQPFAPRFMREGDQVEFTAKVVNLSDKEITGTAQLELLDAATNKPVDGWFKNIFPNQYFTVAAGQSALVKFPITIPYSFGSAMMYRIKAASQDGAFSDGEEMALPVLTNRTLVTETLPINMRNTTNKNFKFDKLLSANNSGTLTHHALTVEYTSNPAWYAVQALPYLMEYPYECVEQNFNRYYANVLASFISNSTPKIKAVFEKWKIVDTAALLSNLQKNEELKSALLAETPWVMNAQNESEQKKNIALLFDMVWMANEKTKTLAKLTEAQTSNGGFAWFKGGPDDRYMTQYIITGIGHLRKLNALTKEDYAGLKPMADRAIPYLDARIKEDYDYLVKHKVKLSQNNLSYYAIQYLYMRSFFPELKVSANAQKAYDYYRGQTKTYWLSQGKYMQGMIALSLHRSGDTKVPQAIIISLKENAIYKEEMGMYWKEFTQGGYYWHQAPIESQAMMIEVFTDIEKNNVTVDDLKTWLLKNKQTNQWASTRSTAEACYALLLNGSYWLAEEKTVTIQLGNTTISSADNKSEEGTGYFKTRIEGAKVQQGMGNINVRINSPNLSTSKPVNNSTSWGAVYWQYFENLDKITSAETPLKLSKKLFVEKNTDKGPVLKAINDGDELGIGDKVKVRIELRVDRDMEYVHMKDMRAACMEPVNVISSYKWQGGLGYYESTKDASTNFFFGWLPRGTYVFEYPLFVTHAGNYSNGITTIQCMYAPEFTSHSEGVRVNVAEK